MLLFVIACLASSFAVSLLATAAMRVLAPRWGLVDQPAARKVHVIPTPLGGGVGIWLGVVVPILSGLGAAVFYASGESTPDWIPDDIASRFGGVLARSWQMLGILAGGTILAGMGLIDDRKNLPWLPRLAVQLLVAIALVAIGIRATVFVPMPLLGAVITVGWIMVLVNSFNFLDNMDGLSSGIALIASLMLAAILLTMSNEPRWLVAGVLLVLAGSLGGFLCHNWPPARIFMGDSGSYFIGLILATMTVLGTFYTENASGRHVILAPLCILAVPLYDFASVMVIRLSQGRSPFQPDKSHFSHRLVELGLKPRNAVLTIHLATLTTGVGGLLLYKVTDWTAALLIVGLILCALAIIAILETVGRRQNGDS